MLSTPDSDLDKYSPSDQIVEMFKQWHSQPVLGFDPETTVALQQATDSGWAAWKAHQLACAYRSTLSEALADDPADKVTSWCRRLTMPSIVLAEDVQAARPPSPKALVETAKWMQVPAEGDPDVVATFESVRHEAWEAAWKEVRNMKLWMRPRWNKAVNESEAAMAETSAESTQPALEA